ncbi:MAG TPA: hypothetical protein VN512_00940 [Clostridia bacterium]|nr:hypothetical protein [Clostridia bacterium]
MKRKLKKTLLDHPFFDYADRRGILLPGQEAARILSGAHPSFEEMVEAAKIRFAEENVSWDAFDDAIALRPKKNIALKQSRSTKTRLVRHRQIAAALVLLLLLAFLAFAPTGRATAANLIDIVMEIIGERTELINRSEAGYGNYAGWEDGETRMYDSFDAFCAETGCTPFVLQANWIESVELTCTFRDGFGYLLTSIYHASSGYGIQTEQIWGTADDLAIRNKYDPYDESIIRNDYTMYYMVNPRDGKFAGVAGLAGSILYISADAGIDLKDLLAAMQ